MAIHLLDDLTCKNVISEGKTIRKLSDGGGLYLWVYADGKKYWRLRYCFNKVEKSLSLGFYPLVTLAKARKLTTENRGKLEKKLDPSQEHKAESCNLCKQLLILFKRLRLTGTTNAYTYGLKATLMMLNGA